MGYMAICRDSVEDAERMIQNHMDEKRISETGNCVCGVLYLG